MTAIDSATVASLLRAHLGQQIAAVERIDHGEWSKAFTFGTAGGEFVVRFSALDEDLRKDQRAMRYASAGLPVPRVTETGTVFDQFYAISERAHGEFIDRLNAEQLRGARLSFA